MLWVQGCRDRRAKGLAKGAAAAHLPAQPGARCRVQTYRHTMSTAPTTPNTQGQQQAQQTAQPQAPSAPKPRFSDWASI